MERLLARLERRLGKYAPQGIILWAVGISGALHLLVFARPEIAHLLRLDADAVLRGEVWRILTFLFAPTGLVTPSSLLWTAFNLWFLHTMGTALEAQWGSFRLDLFLFVGSVAMLLVCFVVGPVTGLYVGAALLLAFAVEFPDFEILLLVLPLKVKYLGVLTGAYLAYQLVTEDVASQAAIGVALGTFLLFCGGTLRSRLRGASGVRRKATPAFAPAPRKTRVCAKCGKSDADDPNLEFRVCDCQDRCHGKLTEYCLEHARAH